MKILICGFMGSGKTSLLEKLKKNSGSYVAFHDLDDVLLQRFGESFKSLGDLIEHRGWDYFRRVESEVLGEFLSASDENLVLALGGGVLGGANLAKIKGNSECRLVFLDTPFDVCFERISGDAGSRPLVKLGRDRLYELYKERLPFYQLAELKLDMAQIAEINRPEQLLES